MSIVKYKAFIQAADSGSFTRASEILHCTQSAVSRMVSDLEDEWGVTLLERGHSGVRLTSEGLKLLPYVRSVCNEVLKLKSAVADLRGLHSGIVRIGAFSSVATYWLPKTIKAFLKNYPNIDYEVLLGDYSEIESWIIEGRVDFGFLVEPCNPLLDIEILAQDELMAVVPKDHPLASLDAVAVEKMIDYPFMLLEKGRQGEFSEVFKRYGIKPNVRCTTWDDYAVMSMTEMGLGISILPKLILQRIPYDIVSKPLDPPAFRSIVLATQKQSRLSLAARYFQQFIKESLGMKEGIF